MPFVWLEADTREARSGLESKAIALLSNYDRKALDAQSSEWLGGYSASDRVVGSSLWNRDFVESPWDEGILTLLERTRV